MLNSKFSIVFTDLDGTLLNHHDYNYEAAIPVIETLKRKKNPVIPVTSKTRREVITLIQNLGLQDPFVVENGSGIFIPDTYQRIYPKFPTLTGETFDGYILYNLGFSYEDARKGLRELEKSLGVSLIGFGDLSTKEVQHLTGLDSKDAKEAKEREFTEPFIIPEGVDIEILERVAQQKGFKVLVGGRFCHLLSRNAGKGKAVDWLVKQYASAFEDTAITTLGLGDSPNDIEMLEAVDKAIIIPGKTGQPNSKLVEKGRGEWTVAACPAPEGWANSLEVFFSEKMLTSDTLL
jgi:mannosyl-3-phosphoglycerate phosphatase